MSTSAPKLADGDRIVRPVELCERLGIGMSTLYAWLADGTAGGAPVPLPRPRQVGPRAVGWPLSEVNEFIKSLPPTPSLPRAKRSKAAA
jgi:predicted DNA-binding transcriptional regulator AlpA